MENLFNIEVTQRSARGTAYARQLRRQGKIPGVIYGGGQLPADIEIPMNKLEQHLNHEAFYSHILDISVDGKREQVILKALQRHPAKSLLMHVDFLRVRQNQEITVHVPIHITGQEVCPGIKKGGMLSTTHNELEVHCLPSRLPEYLAIDISSLEMGDTIHLSQLELPDGVSLSALSVGSTHDSDDAVITIAIPHVRQEVSDETGTDESGADASEF